MKSNWCRWCCVERVKDKRWAFCSEGCREMHARFPEPEPQTTEETVTSFAIADVMQTRRPSGNGEGQRAQASDYQFAMTYQEVAARLGLSWQRIQQIEKQALNKIRAALANDPGLAKRLREAA